MTLAFDLPDCPPSFVQRLDPRWKLAGVVTAAVSITLLQAVATSASALFAALLFVACARLPMGWYLRRLGLAMVMFAILLIWLPLDVVDGRLVLSWAGVERLGVLTAKLAAMLSLILVLVGTTPPHLLFKAAGDLHVPRLLVVVLLLTYRYVFLLREEFGRLRIALRVRGFRNRANLHSYRTIGKVAGTLLVRSHERSERVGQAMQARGFDGRFRSLQEFSTHGVDIAFFGLAVVSAAALLCWDWLLRSGWTS
jgi:cobalt/nickel transport system permease protein